MGTERAARLFVAVAVVGSTLLGARSARSAEPTEAPSADDSKAEEVRVRGNKADRLKRSSGSGTVITEKEIKQAQPENLGEMLRRVPGLQVRQEDAMGLRLNIGVRGLAPQRSRLILIEEDGVPVVVSPYGEPELYYMPAVERVQNVELLKGSDVLRHGPQTVGAIVRLRTWEPTEKRSWYVAGSAGSLGFGQALARYSDTHNGVGYMLQAFHKGGDGYRNMGFYSTDAIGKVRFAVSNKGEIRVKLGFHNEHARTTYTGLTQSMYRKDPRQDTVAPDDYFDIRRIEGSIAHEHRATSKTRLTTTLFAYQMDTGLRLQSFDRQRFPGVEYARIPDPTGLFFRNSTNLRNRVYDVAGLSTELETRFQTGSVDHKLAVGLRGIGEITRRQLFAGDFANAKAGALQTDDTTRIAGLGTWVQDQIAFSDVVVVTPAFRLEHSETTKQIDRTADDLRAAHDVDLSASARSTGAMPGLALTLGRPQLNVFSSFHVGYSAPRVSQSITPSGQDANLKAENSSNYELGTRGKIGKWLRAEADGFLVNFDNQLVSNNPLSSFGSEFINGGKTRHVGFESTAMLRFGQGLALPFDLDWTANYTFVRSRFLGGSFAGNALPYAPPHTVQTTLDAAHKIGVSGQVAFSYVAPQYTDERNTLKPGPLGLDGRIPAFTTVDLGAKYRHKRSGLSFGVAIKNLLDRVYVSDRLPNGIFTAGFRQVFATLAWSSD